MAILISNIRIGFHEPEENAIKIAKKKLKVKDSDVVVASIYKKSLDARRRDITFVYSVLIKLSENEAETAKAVSDPFIAYKPENPLHFAVGNKKMNAPIMIAGFGPAGIFAAHTLAVRGYHPVVFERGESIQQRTKDVQNFWTTGKLNTESNIQFGEGGAGTFSDGKLTTRISDSRCEYILEQLVRHGAPEEILYLSKPHIGTDIFRNVIVSLRKEIEELGGRVCFGSKIENIRFINNRLSAVQVNGELIQTEALILAIGHSARDTFKALYNQSIFLENKPFSVGVRIEQLQETIDRGLYGNLAGNPNLPKGEYQFSYRNKNKCVYTFCMCPGGYVIPSTSQPDMVVTNGMSEHARDGKNANSALVVSVGQEEFGSHPLAGMRFQESLERQAFLLAGQNYSAPAVTIGDFLRGKEELHIRTVQPSYTLGVTTGALQTIFSREIIEMLQMGLVKFDQKCKGFAHPDGILTGVETRTSSPIRITRREDTLESLNHKGLFPCGEGAGYAGGIMSAAVDGIRVAQQVMSEYRPD